MLFKGQQWHFVDPRTCCPQNEFFLFQQKGRYFCIEFINLVSIKMIVHQNVLELRKQKQFPQCNGRLCSGGLVEDTASLEEITVAKFCIQSNVLLQPLVETTPQRCVLSNQGHGDAELRR